MNANTCRVENPQQSACTPSGLTPGQALGADGGGRAPSKHPVLSTFAAGAASVLRSSCRADSNEPAHGLTLREIDVMQWLRIGKTNYEIGCILDISAFTVKNHLHRIFRKLAVANRTHAIAEFVLREHAVGT